MASAVHTINAPATASPAVLIAANDATACWTASSEAQAILASCAKNQPKGRSHRSIFARSMDVHFHYTGRRAARLAAIREVVGDRLMRAAEKSGDWSAFDDWAFEQPRVTEAIDAAVSGHLQSRGA